MEDNFDSFIESVNKCRFSAAYLTMQEKNRYGTIIQNQYELDEYLKVTESEELRSLSDRYDRKIGQLNFLQKSMIPAIYDELNANTDLVKEYFRLLRLAAKNHDFEKSVLFGAVWDGECIDDETMPSLYRIEISDKQEACAGYFIMSDDLKQVENVPVKGLMLNMHSAVNILDESYEDTDYIEKHELDYGVGKLPKYEHPDFIIQDAIENYESKKNGDIIRLAYAYLKKDDDTHDYAKNTLLRCNNYL